MPDALPPNPADQLAPNTQRRVRVLDNVIDTSANVMRLVEQQTQLRFESSLPGADPVTTPWPLITNDPVGAVEKLGKSIRHTVALAEKLEHPRKTGPSNPSPTAPKPKRQVPLDPALMTDEELADALTEARERERAENYTIREQEKPENLDRPFEEMVAVICRTLGLPQLPVGHPWRHDFLTELMPLIEYVEQYREFAAAANHPPGSETPPNAHPPNNTSTAPPDS